MVTKLYISKMSSKNRHGSADLVCWMETSFFLARAFPRLKILVPNICTLENCSKKGGRLSVRIAAPDTNYERGGDALSHKAQRPYRSTRHSETCL